jgi:hypothetical protein
VDDRLRRPGDRRGDGPPELTYKGNLGTFTWRGLITDFRAFNPASDGHVPAGFLGSALILSDKPLAVVGSRSSPIQPGDAAAGFPGVKVP